MKATRKHIALQSIRIFLMVFWLYVSLEKFWNLKYFRAALKKQPFPNWWADMLYVGVPVLEIMIAISLLAIYYISQSDEKLIAPVLDSKPNKIFKAIIGIYNRNRKRCGTLCQAVRQSANIKAFPFLLSALLMLIFTIYVALGVAGIYDEAPCACASLLKNLAWKWHLLLNIGLLAISVTGWSLQRSSHISSPPDGDEAGRPYLYNDDKSQSNLSAQDASIKNQIRSMNGYSFRFYIVSSFKMWFPRKFAPFPGRPVQMDLDYDVRYVT